MAADVNITLALAGVKAAQDELSKLGATLKGAGDNAAAATIDFGKIGTSLASVGAKMALITAPITLIGTSMIKSAADFEASMNRLQVSSGASAATMAKVADAAQDVGTRTTFSAGEAADALVNLQKNNISLEDSMNGVLNAAVDLAAATGTSLAGAADIAAKAMQQFGADATQLPDMMDQLYNATRASTFELGDMAGALAMGGGAAASAGLTFGETSTALATMAYNFGSGSDAGTALKTMLINLASPTKEMAQEANRLGIQIQDANGNMLPMRQIVMELQDGFKGMGSAQKLASAATIGGTDAMRAIVALADQGVAVFDNNTKAINQLGTSHAAATKMMEGFWGAILKLKGAVENISLALLKAGFIDWLTNAAKGMSDVIEWISKLDPMVIKIGGSIALAAVAAGPFTIFLSGLVKTIPLVIGAFGLLNTAVLTLAASIKTLNIAANAFPLVGLANALTFLYQKVEEGSARIVAQANAIPEAVGQIPAEVDQRLQHMPKIMASPFATGVGLILGEGGPVRALVQGVDQVGKETAKTFDELTNSIASTTANAAGLIADNDWGIDKKMAAFDQLAAHVEGMGKVGQKALNDLRDAMKKEALEQAIDEIAAVVDSTTLSFQGQIDKLIEIKAHYQTFGAAGKDAVDKVMDSTKQLQSELGKNIADNDWGLPEKMVAFDHLRASMVAAGNTGAKAMDDLASSMDKGAGKAADELIQKLEDSGTGLEDMRKIIEQAAGDWETYGDNASDGQEKLAEKLRDVNKEMLASDMKDILDDATMSLEDQIAAFEHLRAAAVKAGVDIEPKIKEMNKELDHTNDVLYGVNAGLQDNVSAWGGWGKSAKQVVADFSTQARDGLATFFATGEISLKGFGETVTQIFAQEAADAVVSFASKGIEAILTTFLEPATLAMLGFGTTTATATATASAGIDTTAASAWTLDAALGPILIVVLAIGAAIAILYLAGVDLGDMFSGLIDILKSIGTVLVEALLLPVNLLLEGFKGLNELLKVFVGWIGTIGKELGKGDLKDLVEIFGGITSGAGGILGNIGNAISDVVGDFFGGLFKKEGGKIGGSGAVPIVAHGGEYVMTAAATAMYEPLFKALNARASGGQTRDLLAEALGMGDRYKGVREFAHGGDMLLTRPTLLLGGEAGAERVSFTPAAGRGRDSATVVNNGIMVADRMTLRQLSKKIYDQGEADRRRRRGG